METHHNNPIATRIRIVLGTLFLTSVLFPSLYQPFLTALWTWLSHNSFYQLSTFETIWTVFFYAAIEVPLTVVFLRHPEWRFATQEQTKKSDDAINNDPGKKNGATIPRPRGMRRPSRRLREIAIYITPLLLMDLTMIKKFADVPLAAMLESGNYHDAASALSNNSTVSSETSTPPYRSTFLVPTLHNITLASPLQTTRALPPTPPTSRRLALELTTSFFLYDFLFFLFHLLLHTLPPLKSYHLPHHTHAEIHPQITNQLHISERLGLVLLANFSLNIIGSHVLTRTLFVPVFVWLLVEIHSGCDLPWGYEKVLPKGWGGGAGKHARHHRDGGGGFEPYFCWWDGVWELLNRGSGGGKRTGQQWAG